MDETELQPCLGVIDGCGDHDCEECYEEVWTGWLNGFVSYVAKL